MVHEQGVIQEFAAQFQGDERPLRLRQAVVDSTNTATGTLVAKVGGSSTPIPDIRYVGWPPVAGQTCWLLGNGPDYLALPALGLRHYIAAGGMMIQHPTDTIMHAWRHDNSDDASKNVVLLSTDGLNNFSLYQPGATRARLQWNTEPSIRALRTDATVYIPMRASAFTVTSDSDVKQDMQPLEGGCEEYLNPSPVFTYRLKGEQRRRVGMLADQLPALVVEEVDGYRMVDTYGALALTWKSVQGHHKKIEVLEGKVADLETTVVKLTERLAALERKPA